MTMTARILRRIQRRGRGNVFTAKDFIDIGSRAAVDQALSRFARQGVVRRLRRGLYDYPKVSKRLGLLSPSPDSVAGALARQTGSKVQVSGARAANILGLTDQVPAKLVYVTDGRTRNVRIGNQHIVLQHASSRNLAGLGRPTGMVIQALRYLGKDNVVKDTIDQLRAVLTSKQMKELQRDSLSSPDWTRKVVQQIAMA
jgi:predicted transcriptional regulator of viral defense system